MSNLEKMLRHIIEKMEHSAYTDGNERYIFAFDYDNLIMTVHCHAWKLGDFNLATGEIILDNNYIYPLTNFVTLLINTHVKVWAENMFATYKLNLFEAIRNVPTQI